jgi:hypothetical protein
MMLTGMPVWVEISAAISLSVSGSLRRTVTVAIVMGRGVALLVDKAPGPEPDAVGEPNGSCGSGRLRGLRLHHLMLAEREILVEGLVPPLLGRAAAEKNGKGRR